jgi:hypothetical protein
MSNTPLYFIKKLTEHDLGIRNQQLYQRACWFSCQRDPILKFFQNINTNDMNEGEKRTFTYLYLLPNNFGHENFNLKVRRYGALVFEFAFNRFAERLQLLPNEVFVIEQSVTDHFEIKIMKTDHPNYDRTNTLLNNGRTQLCTTINPFE